MDQPEQLQELVNGFYKGLFFDPDPHARWRETKYSFAPLETAEVDSLNAPCSMQEIREALFMMDPWKAPGPDRFPVGFYQGQ